MISPIGMETFEARLQSFNIAHATTKKRTSNAKGAAKLRWPHKSPDPAQLARAGFFYNPKASAPDNTTCYLCHSNLDGWEEEDSAFGEHLNFSPDCGWAVIAQIEQDGDGNLAKRNPTDESLLNARMMTFGANWPHEHKRGWVCKTQKMVEGGWYYYPTPESDDSVKCCYCRLSLDGWEPKDDPYHEHQRRSPDCMFFALSKPEGKRTARGKKGRASKGSRLSTQSNLTTASEDIPMIDVNMNGDYTMSAQEPEIVAPSKATKGAKNGTRGKKAAPKSGRKVSTIQQEEIVPGSSFAEPEDDDFEVKVEQKPSQKTTGMKRKSDDMSLDEDLVQAGMHHGHPQSQEPPTKRRATRTCVPGPNAASDPELGTGQHDDSLMTDLESMPAPPPPVSRKTTKGGKRKASSSTRKASATSTASKASLRAAIPDDEEIDAALEADLNRPLTDDEVELEPALIPKGKTRRLTRTRPGSRHVTASTAPVRRTTHASALPVEGDSMTSIDASAKDSQVEAAEQPKAVEIALTAMDHAKQEIIAETDKHIASKAKTRGRPRSTSTKAAKKGKGAREDNLEDKDSESIPHKSSISVEAPQMSEGQQESDQLPETSTRMSGGSVGSLKDEKAVQLDSSTLAPGEALKSSDVEMQDSQANQSRAKKGGKQRSAAAKKLRPNKRGAANNPNNEETVQVEAGDVGRGEPVVVVELTSPDDEQDIGERTLPVETPIKDGPGGKGKGKKPKKRTAAKSKKRDTLPPSEACAVSQVEPGELPSIAARKQDTTTEIPTPADSQGQDDGHKVSVRFPTPPVQATSAQQTPKTVNSPQSSDAENQPPSARPSALRPPLLVQTPSKSQTARVPLAATTPTASPWKRNISRLQTSLPWTSIDIERIFNSPAADKENVPGGGIADSEKGLSSPEKKLTVEEWIRWNAKRGEEKLREDCERLVGKFEGEGVRALKTLEGIVCAD